MKFFNLLIGWFFYFFIKTFYWRTDNRCDRRFDWHTRDKPPNSNELVDRTAPYYEFCIENFGCERCMFESNFPVDKDSVSYPVLWNAFKKLTAAYSPAERLQLFHGTAVKVYRLNRPSPANPNVHPSSSALNSAGGA